jgi:hypothetical protein
MCSSLKPNEGQRDEMRYTFDVSKCDHFFDLLLRGGLIQLIEGHVIPSADILAKKTYCKWHNSYTHTTNECNYFRQQVQSAINDSRLTLGDGVKMKLDMNLFPISMVELKHKKILVCTDCHTQFLCQNQVLIVWMTQDQLFYTYGQKGSQISKCHEYSIIIT